MPRCLKLSCQPLFALVAYILVSLWGCLLSPELDGWLFKGLNHLLDFLITTAILQASAIAPCTECGGFTGWELVLGGK